MCIPVFIFSCSVRNDFKLSRWESHVHYLRGLLARSWGTMWLDAGSQVSSGQNGGAQWAEFSSWNFREPSASTCTPIVWLNSGRGLGETEEPFLCWMSAGSYPWLRDATLFFVTCCLSSSESVLESLIWLKASRLQISFSQKSADSLKVWWSV